MRIVPPFFLVQIQSCPFVHLLSFMYFWSRMLILIYDQLNHFFWSLLMFLLIQPGMGATPTLLTNGLLLIFFWSLINIFWSLLDMFFLIPKNVFFDPSPWYPGVPYFCKSPFDFLVNLPDHLGPHLLLIFRLQHHIQRLQPQKRAVEAFGRSTAWFPSGWLNLRWFEIGNWPGMKLRADSTPCWDDTAS